MPRIEAMRALVDWEECAASTDSRKDNSDVLVKDGIVTGVGFAACIDSCTKGS